MDLPFELPPELQGRITPRTLRRLLPSPDSFHKHEDFWCAKLDLERALAQLSPAQLFVMEMLLHQGQSEDDAVAKMVEMFSLAPLHARRLVRDTVGFLEAQMRMGG